MNQGKLEVVKQNMARMNINILGISELKWTGMCKFNSDDHYIYYCGKESLVRNGNVFTVNKTVQNAVLGCSLKNNRMILVNFFAAEDRDILYSQQKQDLDLTMVQILNSLLQNSGVD